MKFRVTMKTRDALDQAIEDAVAGMPTANAESNEDVYCQQQDALMDITRLCEKWFQHDEVLTVEIDTEAQTCTVVPVGE